MLFNLTEIKRIIVLAPNSRLPFFGRKKYLLIKNFSIFFFVSTSFIPLSMAQIKIIENLNALGISHLGSYSKIGPQCRTIAKWAHENKIPFNSMLCILYDDDGQVPTSALRSDAAVMVDPDFKLDPSHAMIPETGEQVRSLKLGGSGSEFAEYLWEGPLDSIHKGWSKFLTEEIPKLGRRLAKGDQFLMFQLCPVNPISNSILYARLEPQEK